MGHIAAIPKIGPSIVLQAVHAEGVYDGEWLLVTDAQVKDEAAHMKALGDLRALFDSHGLKDIRINAYRVVAGRSDRPGGLPRQAPRDRRPIGHRLFVRLGFIGAFEVIWKGAGWRRGHP
jgi:hypothetical protein